MVTIPCLPNTWRSAEERRDIYLLARSWGLNSATAAKLRDWRMDFVQWFYERYITTGYPVETHSQIRERLRAMQAEHD